MRVAVLIAMPSPSRSTNFTSTRSHSPLDDRRPPHEAPNHADPQSHAHPGDALDRAPDQKHPQKRARSQKQRDIGPGAVDDAGAGTDTDADASASASSSGSGSGSADAGLHHVVEEERRDAGALGADGAYVFGVVDLPWEPGGVP